MLLLEGVMIVLILANLTWMIFDFSFTAQFFQKFIKSLSASFYHFYNDRIHPHFLMYDLIFVSIFLAEFIGKWIYSIFKNTYNSWAAYPFVFWYDLLGCLPFGSFRFLRLLRIVSLIIRLQKREVIDVTDSWWYKGFNKYYQIFIEEVSDRVVTNVLTGVQKELKYDDDTVKRVIQEAIVPNQEQFALWLSQRVQFAVGETYSKHKDDFRKYVDDTVAEAVEKNEDLQKVELIPVFGKQISRALANSVADISFNVIDKMMKDLSSNQADSITKEALQIGLSTASYSSGNIEKEEISTKIVDATIEVLKKQVNKKHHQKD